jgi:hypothetical protein
MNINTLFITKRRPFCDNGDIFDIFLIIFLAISCGISGFGVILQRLFSAVVLRNGVYYQH